jgi:hypothetical protein
MSSLHGIMRSRAPRRETLHLLLEVVAHKGLHQQDRPVRLQDLVGMPGSAHLVAHIVETVV